MSYLVAHACFTCRKSFKVGVRGTRVPLCPQCRRPMGWMGRAFKAPPSRDKAQWEKVHRLHTAGFRFTGYRRPGWPQFPDKLCDVEAFIRDYPTHPARWSEFIRKGTAGSP